MHTVIMLSRDSVTAVSFYPSGKAAADANLRTASNRSLRTSPLSRLLSVYGTSSKQISHGEFALCIPLSESLRSGRPQARVACHVQHVLSLPGAYGVASSQAGGQVSHLCLFCSTSAFH